MADEVRIEGISRAVRDIEQALDDAKLQPDPARRHWDGLEATIAALAKRFDEDVLRPLTSLLADIDDVAMRERLCMMVARLASDLGALVRVSGDPSGARALVEKTLACTSGTYLDGELAGTASDPHAWIALVHADWKRRRGDIEGADRILQEARTTARHEALRKAIDQLIDAPVPLQGGAPSMATLNGFGTVLVGERDPWPDGSYVATLCVCLFFLPVFPLSAYRVIRDGNSYLFLGKTKLSSFARYARWAISGAVALAVAGLGTSSYLDSPERRAWADLEDARAAETSGQRIAALGRYARIAQLDAGEASQSAAAAMVRVLASQIPRPATKRAIERIEGLVRRYERLPEGVRRGPAEDVLLSRLARWAREIGGPDEAAERSSLRVLELAASASTGPRHLDCERRVREKHARLGRFAENAWPVEAFSHFVAARDVDHAAELLTRFADAPWVVAETAPVITKWRELGVGRHMELSARAERALERYEQRSANVARTRALESGDPAALRAIHETSPDDQVVATALADLARGEGRFDDAIAMLDAYGGPGMLTTGALGTLALSHMDAGRLVEAEALLTRKVDAQLPTFIEAQRVYSHAASARADALMEGARAGNQPTLTTRLDREPNESRRQQMLDEWLQGEIERDPTLRARRAAYEEAARIVPVVLDLGTIELQRARGASSASERQTFLGAAERLFRSIRQEAEGEPGYRLMVAQVHHRLGRTEEGERELQSVLADSNLSLHLDVAHTYRDLGLTERARTVAESVYTRGQRGSTQEQDASVAAARLMVLLSRTPDDEARWLARLPDDAPGVRLLRLRAAADAKLRARDLPAADRLYGELAAAYEGESQLDAATSNNAALAHAARYGCTGEARHLDRAVDGLERALRMQPQVTIVQENLAELHLHRGLVRVLDRWVRASALRLERNEALSVLGVLSTGPRREEVTQAARSDASLRRALALVRQAQVLSPQRASLYSLEWFLLQAMDDRAGMRELATRLEAVRGLETTEQREALERWRRGDSLERARAEAEANVADADAVLAAAIRARHTPTLATAHYLRGSFLLQRGSLNARVEDARAAVTAFREAVAAWDGLSAQNVLARPLVVLATLEAGASSAEVRDAWSRDWRTFEIGLLLHRLVERSATAGDVVRARPEIGEAVTLLQRNRAEDLGFLAWLIGRVARNAALEQAAHAALRAEAGAVAERVSRRLDPASPESVERSRLLAEAPAHGL